MTHRSSREEKRDKLEQPAAEPPHLPTWLRRAICFISSVFLAFCAVYTCINMVLEGAGIVVGIVGAIVFAAMAVHMFRSGLGDGRWRVGR